MSFPYINVTAVLASAVVFTLVSWMWHGTLFGRVWKKLAGTLPEKEEKERTGRNYTITFVVAFALAYFMAGIFSSFQPMVFWQGLWVGFWLWLGFVATSGLTSALWGARPWKLYFLDAGFYLVSMLMMGAILAMWWP